MPVFREVPVYKPLIADEEKNAAIAALDNGWLGMGSFVKQFEDEIQAVIGSPDRHPVAVSTGHAALHLALLLNDVGPGDEVLTPAFNNIADFQAILETGAKPVFCDVNDDDLTINLNKCEDLVSKSTRTMIVIDYNMSIADHDQISDFAKEHRLNVIHDAAHSIGATYKGVSIGNQHSYTMFSFDAVKTFTAIDGGILVVTSEDEREALREMRMIGQAQAPALLYKDKRQWRYDVKRMGFRYHMANLHEAIGLAQLKKRARIQRSRQDLLRFYNENLSEIEEVRAPKSSFGPSNPFMYHIRVGAEVRDHFRSYLADFGVGTGIHWQPGHWFSLFDNCRQGDLKVSDRVGREIVTLPFHSMMDHDDRDHVVDVISSYFSGR